MTTTDVLDRGRAAFARHAWGDAYAQLSAADGVAALEGASSSGRVRIMNS
jgi:hypothetical protein